MCQQMSTNAADVDALKALTLDALLDNQMTRARDSSNLMGSGNFSSTTFTATAGQTAFTIAHTQGFVQVFMNGLVCLTTDYTSNGSAIILQLLLQR